MVAVGIFFLPFLFVRNETTARPANNGTQWWRRLENSFSDFDQESVRIEYWTMADHRHDSTGTFRLISNSRRTQRRWPRDAIVASEMRNEKKNRRFLDAFVFSAHFRSSTSIDARVGKRRFLQRKSRKPRPSIRPQQLFAIISIAGPGGCWRNCAFVFFLFRRAATSFYRVLPSFTELYLVLPSFT